MKGTTLKPCPFCGGEARLLDVKLLIEKSWEHFGWQVFCQSCDGSSDLFTDSRGGRDTAIERWNRRTTENVAVNEKGLKSCPFCGSTNVSYSGYTKPVTAKCWDCGGQVTHSCHGHPIHGWNERPNNGNA